MHLQASMGTPRVRFIIRGRVEGAAAEPERRDADGTPAAAQVVTLTSVA